MFSKIPFLQIIWTMLCPSLLWAQQSTLLLRPDSILIIRDSFGVPHIFAPTDAEAAYGLAWAHSEDDFPSLFTNMTLGKGRLGELNGVEGAKTDFFAQYIRASERVEADFDKLPEDYKQLLAGYAAGLNAYAAAHPKECKLKGVFPITPKDIEKAHAIVVCAMTGAPFALQAAMQGKNYENAISVGSNGVAMSKKLTLDGSTYLMNDPHWLSDGAITFYEAHLVSAEGWNISGGFYPGIPYPANGVTPNLGWNLPFNFPDLVDVYELEINPNNPNQYKVDNEWFGLEERKIKLTVKLGFLKLKVKKKAYWSIFGPTIKTKKGQYFATRFAGNEKIGSTYQLYKMSKAENFTQFRKAVADGYMPLFNIIYADKYDTIYYGYKGLIPERNPNYDWQKTLKGNTKAVLWDKFISYDSMPEVINPNCGYVYNMNSSPYFSTCESEVPQKNSYYQRGGFYLDAENDRSTRFRELIGAKTKFSYDDFKATKYDLEYPKTDGGFIKTLQKIQKIDASKFPKIKDALLLLQKAKLDGTLGNRYNALFFLALDYIMHKYDPNKRQFLLKGLEFEDAVFAEAVEDAQKKLKKFAGRIDPTWGEVQFLVRGNQRIPAAGIAQNLNSVESKWTKKGLQVTRNSSFLQFARFAPDGNVYLETAHTYGNSNRKNSPHYSDQMLLNTQFKTKKMLWKKEELLKVAEKNYHPK